MGLNRSTLPRGYTTVSISWEYLQVVMKLLVYWPHASKLPLLNTLTFQARLLVEFLGLFLLLP